MSNFFQAKEKIRSVSNVFEMHHELTSFPSQTTTKMASSRTWYKFVLMN